jgi:hypothetical protein
MHIYGSQVLVLGAYSRLLFTGSCAYELLLSTLLCFVSNVWWMCTMHTIIRNPFMHQETLFACRI